jgi:2-keto-4-pentenoate hydratase/2-oxohepta-3-ene-1,7-dioic acid hydratase in catechol pathway
MRLLTFRVPGDAQAAPRLGALLADGGTVVDLAAGCRLRQGAAPGWCADMLAWLDGGPRARDAARELVQWAHRERPPQILHRLADVTLLAPLPRPRSLRDAMTFERHVVQTMRAVLRQRARWVAAVDAWLERWCGRGVLRPPAVWYERPVYYKGNPLSVVGPEADIRWPAYTNRLDYELEFGMVIGQGGTNIPKATAREHIVGYTIFNDVSARDAQLREMTARLGPAKGTDVDTGNAIGPYLVTPEEVPDPYHLTMIARVNGEEWSRGNSRQMHWTFEDLIATISEEETLHPGEFIGSGAIGNGCGLELDRWLSPGDVVELEVERLGVLRNRIVKGGEP